jgi:CIC family chloride channel protein
LLTRALRKMQHLSGKTPFPFWLRAALGGAVVGLIGFFLPDVMGEGYHAIHKMIGGGYSPGLAIAAFLVLAKILATSFTLGWGGSGGIFAPCLVVGAFAGLAWHRLIVSLWPDLLWVGEGCFALVGMAGMIGGILQAPLTGIFLIVEITGGYDVILPLILVSAVSTTLCNYIEPASFYLKDLVDKGEFLRPGTDGRVLADLSVRELLEKDCMVVRPDMLLRQFVDVVKGSHRNHFPVEDVGSGRFLGMINLDDIRPYLFEPYMYDTVFLDQIMNRQVETAHPEDDLNDVLIKMDTARIFSLPVVANGRFLGMISKATLLDQYRKELRVQTMQ